MFTNANIIVGVDLISHKFRRWEIGGEKESAEIFTESQKDSKKQR